jgi:hypothetical protein
VLTLLSLSLVAHLVAGQLGAPAAPHRADDGLQCGSHLITVGDLKSQVFLACGAPLLHEQRTEERPQGSTTVSVTIDVWTYDRGPYSFLRTLTFENGRLVEILASGLAR